jgi:3-hydroxyacyl-CoA dehydrogenase
MRSCIELLAGILGSNQDRFTKAMSKEESRYQSWQSAQRVCVIGAGTMGAGIAAHLSNIGFQVSLLDLSRESATEGLARAKAAKPPHFYVPERAAAIELGGIRDGADFIAQADWVCEAIVEKLDLKRALFAEIEPMVREDAMVSTNTSGLQISLLTEGLSESFRRRFLGTHFFNPPRYLKLLELIPTDDTDPEAVRAMAEFLENRAARRVVVAKDTPGFIANRYGMWAMFHAIHAAERLHLTIEQVDAITGPFLGRPRSGSFRLNDIVGLDIMKDIAANLVDRCPNDPHIGNFNTPKSMDALIARGWIGEKVRQGYYRKEGKELLALNLQTYAYNQRIEPSLPTLDELGKLPLGDRIGAALERRDEVGEFLRGHLIPVLRYADYLKAEVSHSIEDFDRVMMWGFGWQMGPFEMIDAIGANKLGMNTGPYYQEGKQKAFDGTYVNVKSQPEYATLADFPRVGGAETYNVYDLGDGINAVALKTKMGVISPKVVKELTDYLSGEPKQPFVFTSEAKSFSVGFDLNFFSGAIERGAFEEIDQALIELQQLGELFEKFECVSAVFGHCLGGGMELALSCTRVVASAEANIGLPEARVGLIPGGRGTTLMRIYNQFSAKRLSEVASAMVEGAISNSADHARSLGYLRQSDVTVYHPDRLLMDAKRVAMTAGVTNRPYWHTPEGPLGGMIDREIEQGRQQGLFTTYDKVIGEKVRSVFARGQSYEDALRLERAEFVDLCKRALSQARIRHMVETNKPLRN